MGEELDDCSSGRRSGAAENGSPLAAVCRPGGLAAGCRPRVWWVRQPLGSATPPRHPPAPGGSLVRPAVARHQGGRVPGLIELVDELLVGVLVVPVVDHDRDVRSGSQVHDPEGYDDLVGNSLLTPWSPRGASASRYASEPHLTSIQAGAGRILNVGFNLSGRRPVDRGSDKRPSSEVIDQPARTSSPRL